MGKWGETVMQPSEQPERRASTHREKLYRLTVREMEVLSLLGQGLSNKEIALKLDISAHTAKSHVASILKKLDLSNRKGAIRFWMEALEEAHRE